MLKPTPDSCGRGPGAGVVCRNPEHRASWVVVHRNGNYSAFNGYRWTPSAYSLVKCTTGGSAWRTRALYVTDLPDQEA